MEIEQGLRALAVLAEDLDSISSTTWWLTAISELIPGGPIDLYVVIHARKIFICLKIDK